MKLTSTLFLSLFVFLVLCGQSAVAERYMIRYKNPNSFAANMIPDGVEVTQTLVHIGTSVVEVSSAEELAALAETPGIARIEKEIFHPLPMPVNGYNLTPSWNFSLEYSLTEENVEIAQNKLGAGTRTPWGIKTVKAEAAWVISQKGKGARVVILDTGIDHNHPAIKDNFEKGEDFIGDNNVPYAYADHVGHGTHVAGTIAASQASTGFTGVAPKATILAGRVCADEGCSNIAVAEGINWAIGEKADVINMSLGGIFATPMERDAVAAAEAAGVVVVAATGNDGVAKVSFPAAFPTAIAVGAISQDHKRASFSQYGPELDIVAPGVDVESSVPLGSGRESEVNFGLEGVSTLTESTSFSGSALVEKALEKSVVHVGLAKPADFKGINLKGQFALIKRGEITFEEKVKNAMAADADGVVVYNNEAGLIQGALTEDGSTLAIPVVMVTQSVGEKVAKALAAGSDVTFSIRVGKTDYAGFSGTSMACPHVAGVVALVKAANPKLTPAEVRELLSKSATSLGATAGNETGSGLVDAEKAVTEAVSLR